MSYQKIKQKINLTGNISEIVHAIEVTSIMKMKKTQKIALESRPFAIKFSGILARLLRYQEGGGFESDFFKEGKGDRILMAVLTSDRGFCGFYNKSVLKMAEEKIKEFNGKQEIEVVAIGKKTINFFKRRNAKVIKEFVRLSDFPSIDHIKPISNFLIEQFETQQYKKILFFFGHFVSTFIYEPKMVELLPSNLEQFTEELEKVTGKAEIGKEKFYDYIFEPSPEIIFKKLIPLLIRFRVYHLVLGAKAAEYSSRMVAMKRASENAKDLLRKLILKYNEVRQEQITSELLEITSAKEVLI